MKLEDAKALAEAYLEQYNLLDWNFRFDRAKLRLGLCRYNTKTISLSAELTLLNDEKVIENTILHELAHALVGPNHGHNHVWQNMARSIGCSAERCAGDVNVPEGKYSAKCGNCGKVSFRNRKLNKKVACGRCCRDFNSGVFTEKFLLEFK